MGDPRRRVLARIETEPIPFGLWDSLSDALMETAADFGVMCGGHVVDCAEDGWEPAEGAEPESWRPVAEIERLRARVAELENEICERDGATDVAVVDAVSRAERRVDDLLAGREVDPAGLNAMLARRFLRILNLRTSDLAHALDTIARRDSAIREAIDVLGPEPCACEGMASEVAEALRLLRGALGESDRPSTRFAARVPRRSRRG